MPELWAFDRRNIIISNNKQLTNLSMKQKFTYLLSLMLLCILGVSNAMAEDVVVYSMSAPTAPSEAVASKATVAVTATFVGGSAYVYNGHGSDAKIMVQSSQIKLGGSSGSWFHAELGSAMEAGDVITIYSTGTTKDEKENAYKMSSASSPSTNFTFPYTVKAGDGFAGKKDIYLSKSGSNAFSQITVTRAPAANPPSITAQPQDVNVTLGSKATLSLTVAGGETYQWYKATSATSKDGATAVSGATAATYQYTPAALGTEYFYCKVTNGIGSVESNIATVTTEEYKPITTVRNWLFTQQSKYASDQAAATSLWGDYSSSNKRYANARALAEEELSGNDGPLYGLAGIYFTAPAGKLLLGGKDDNSRSMQSNGSGVYMIIPQCNLKDRITLRWGASGSGKSVSIAYGTQTITQVGVDRTHTDDLISEVAGDVTIGIPSGIRIYEVTVTPYFAVTGFDLSAEEVSVEEFEKVSVSGTNFTPTNATDKSLNWVSSDESVATVSNGIITGVKEGTATITATSVDGPSKSLTVTVTPCAPKNASIEMSSNSDVAAPKVESGKTYKLTAKVQGYDLTYQWASKDSEKGSYSNISGATSQTYEETAVELGSKYYKVTITNPQGSTTSEYEVKTVVPLEAFTITEVDPETEATTSINYKAIDADEPQVKVVSQPTKADEETVVALPESVEYNGLTYAVTTVGDEALTTTP